MTKLTDAELAEKAAVHVMGWEKCRDPWNLYNEWWDKGDGDDPYVFDFDPCNDWNDMRLVIEKMREQFDIVDLIFDKDGVLVEFCDEIYKKSMNDFKFEVQFDATDEKPGRAVCSAALKAKGVEL